jgi:hemoglobin
VTVETPADLRRQLARSELASATMYELIGGPAGVRSVAEHFYDLMDADERFADIRAMHDEDLAPMRLALYEFLSGWLGGPQLYLERKGGICLTGPHAAFAIDHEARDAWVDCMAGALRAAGVEQRYRELLEPSFAQMAEVIRNQE